MATEQDIRLTVKLYEMRDSAKFMLGDKYAEKMAEFRKAIEIVQLKLHLDNPLAAATRICQNPDAGGFDVILLMAAACEMIEPSRPST
jgi:hypothetical protein